MRIVPFPKSMSSSSSLAHKNNHSKNTIILKLRQQPTALSKKNTNFIFGGFEDSPFSTMKTNPLSSSSFLSTEKSETDIVVKTQKGICDIRLQGDGIFLTSLYSLNEELSFCAMTLVRSNKKHLPPILLYPPITNHCEISFVFLNTEFDSPWSFRVTPDKCCLDKKYKIHFIKL